MAFTSTDLTNIETAIKDIANGARKVLVDIDGRITQYAAVRLPELIDLRDRVKAELASADISTIRRTRLYRATYSKGL